MTTDDYVTRLREAALASVPPSTLDLETVLRSSRRKAALWRAGTGAGLCLAVAAGGVGVANALPLLPGLVDSPTLTGAAPAAIGLTDLSRVPYRSTIETQEMVPGVTVVTAPGSTVVGDDALLLDLGLPAGDDGDRYFVRVTVRDSGSGTLHPVRADLLAGNRHDQEVLLGGGEAGEYVADALGTFHVVEDAETGQRLVFGMEPVLGTDAGDEQHHGRFLFRDPVTTYAGAEVLSIDVPAVDVLGDDRVHFYAAAFGASPHGPQEPEGAMPGLMAFDELRGYLGYDAQSGTGVYASCWSTTELGEGPCTTLLDLRTGSVKPADEVPANPVDPDVGAAILAQLLGTEFSGEAASARAFVACMAARGEVFQVSEVEQTWLGDPHPRADAETWHRCAADVMDVRAAAGLETLRRAALDALAEVG